VDLPTKSEQEQALAVLKNLAVDGQYSVSIPQAPYFPNIEDQLVPIWEIRPQILTFHFGIPSVCVMEKARALGIAVGITATSLEEAKAIENAGANFIVAQGIEAGGHRGIFDINSKDQNSRQSN